MADTEPKMQKKQHKKWMTEGILNLMEDRRKSKSNIDLYKTLNTQTKDKCNEAKVQWINQQCKEMENNLTVDSKYMHSKIKDIKGTKGCTASNCIKAKDENLLMEREDVLNRWSEYIEDLFQDDRGEKPIIKKDMNGPPILKEEVSAAIRKMKHGKAVGPNNIPIEVFAVLEDIGIDFLTKLLNSIYDSGKIPKDLAKSVFITLPKIPGTMECELYRTVSLMSHLTKVLLRIILARMRKSLRPEISQLQFGFVPDKSTRNAIFNLSMLTERCIEMQKDLYLCFIDYSKAFDKVRLEKLFNILEHLDIDGKDLRVIRNLYWDQSAAVRIGGELSEYKRNLVMIDTEREFFEQSDSLKILYLNTQSLRNKATLLNDMIHELNIDIAYFTESWLKSSGDEVIIQNLTPEGFKAVSFHSESGHGGGISIVHRESMTIDLKRIRTFHSFE